MGNKIHFTSLGCARNLVDTEVMIGLVIHAGYKATPSVEEADFLVVIRVDFSPPLAKSRVRRLASFSKRRSGFQNDCRWLHGAEA